MNQAITAIEGTGGAGPEICARCGHAMMEMHCRVFCTNCGYMRDCNDQWE